jgi:hypothetical protein
MTVVENKMILQIQNQLENYGITVTLLAPLIEIAPAQNGWAVEGLSKVSP